MSKKTPDPNFSQVPTRLMTDVGRIGWLVPIGLLVVLISNIVALTMPFMELGVPFNREVYSIPHGIQLMWSFGYYALAILIFSFSLAFPLLKTAALIVIWFIRIRPKPRHHIIRVLESLGKWSMLDIFVVVILMVLANDQQFVNAKPKSGLTFFIFAIIGNMLMSRLVEMIHSRLHYRPNREAESEEEFEPLTSTGWMGWLMPLILIFAFASVLVAVEMPFLKINDALLRSYSYSVVQASQALFEQDAILLGLFIVVFVAVAPLLNIALITWTWFTKRTHEQSRKRLELSRIIGEWSMMSVFLLALVLTISEGQKMIRTDMRDGALAMAISLAICLVAIRLARWLISKRMRSPVPSDAKS